MGGRIAYLQMKRLRDQAKWEKATDGAAGYDMHACLDHPVYVGHDDVTLIPTGFAVAIPAGYVGLIFPRSGSAVRDGLVLANSTGVIDSDYRGEVMVPLITRKRTKAAFVKPGDRIAQIVFVWAGDFVFKEVEELPPTRRGEGGFGSTGQGKKQEIAE